MGLDFPKARNDWKFDLVGLLAIIGESIIDEVVQPLTASRTVFLPRLLPAPHALIRPSRRAALPSTPVNLLGIYNGTKLESIPYFPSMIHQVDLLEPYEFQELTISMADLDRGEVRADRRPNKIATVAPLAPLRVITVFSFLWTMGILVWAVILHDGPAVVAIILVSLASSLHSAASFWQAETTRDRRPGRGFPGDVVLRTRSGAFVVVHCTQDVARLLYFDSGRCYYVLKPKTYQLLVYIGTLLLMVGIVMMSNCSWTMQVTLGASYLGLNGLYMFCALTPSVSRLWHWNLQMIRVELNQSIVTTNFTQALWQAIRATKSIDWVREGKIAPSTPQWNAWLDEARENCDDPHWSAEAARDKWMATEFAESGDPMPRAGEKTEVQDDSVELPKRRQTLL